MADRGLAVPPPPLTAQELEISEDDLLARRLRTDEDFAKDFCRLAVAPRALRDAVTAATTQGWDTDRKDYDGVTVLYAAATIGCRPERVDALLRVGGNPHLACAGRHLGIEMLRVHFCDQSWARYAAQRDTRAPKGLGRLHPASASDARRIREARGKAAATAASTAGPTAPEPAASSALVDRLTAHVPRLELRGGTGAGHQGPMLSLGLMGLEQADVGVGGVTPPGPGTRSSAGAGRADTAGSSAARRPRAGAASASRTAPAPRRAGAAAPVPARTSTAMRRSASSARSGAGAAHGAMSEAGGARVRPPLRVQSSLVELAGSQPRDVLECLSVLLRGGVGAGARASRALRMPPLREKPAAADPTSSGVGGVVPLSQLRSWCRRAFLAATAEPDKAVRSRLVRLCSRFKPLDPDAGDPWAMGRTPLQWACVAGDPASVDILLRAGANPAALDPVTRLSPLALVLLAPDARRREAMVKLLCDDDARRGAASGDPWGARRALESPAFWTDMLLGPGEERPLPAGAARIGTLDPMIPEEVLRDDVIETAAQVSADAAAEPGSAQSLALAEVATARRLRLARQQVGSAGSASRDRGWAGFSLLHAAADMAASEPDGALDRSPLLLLRAMRARSPGMERRACRARDARGRTPAEATHDCLAGVRRTAPGRSDTSSRWGWDLWRLLAELASEEEVLSAPSEDMLLRR